MLAIVYFSGNIEIERCNLIDALNGGNSDGSKKESHKKEDQEENC